MGQVGAFETEDEVPGPDSYTPAGEYFRSIEEREYDLRVKMFALDMAVQSLPHLISMADNDERKLNVIRRTTAEYEKILKGEA